MIDIRNISFKYLAQRTMLFDDFSMQFRPGTVCGLLGKNGTGKSTLLYLIAGLLFPKSGTITMDGKDTSARSADTLSEIFLVPEEFELPDISLDRYVEINSRFYPRFSHEKLEQCLALFELPSDLDLGQLSMGQKKKVFMSFALATQTRLLLMDEPTNGLDIPSKAQFRRVVSSGMDDNRTIIISTHQVHDVETLIDHVVMIDRNGLILDADMQRLSESLSFEQRRAGEPMDDVLYSEPSLGGSSVIARGAGSVDGVIDLELLFSALCQNPKLREELNAGARVS